MINLDRILDVMKDEFENDELVKDENIKKLELNLNNLLQRVFEIDPELSFDIDSLHGEIASAYVNCCFKNGVRYGLNIK